MVGLCKSDVTSITIWHFTNYGKNYKNCNVLTVLKSKKQKLSRTTLHTILSADIYPLIVDFHE